MSIIYISSRGVAGPQGIQGDPGAGVINWLGVWDSGTTYEINDAVSYQGSSYICLVQHSNQVPPNPTYWGVLAEVGDTGATGLTGDTGLGITWLGDWDSGDPYVVNDAVVLDGTSYICIQDHTNQQPPNVAYWNILAQKGGTGATGNTGATGARGLTWRNAWNSITAYAVDDAVQYNGSAYICLQAHTNQFPTNPTYWSLLASKGDTGTTGDTGLTGAAGADGQGFTWRGSWSGAITYAPYDVVEFDGSSYNCILGHTNQTPPNPTYWETMAQAGEDGSGGGGSGEGLVTEAENTNAGSISKCRVVYISGVEEVDLARANNTTTAKAFGLVADNSISASVSGNIQISGILEATTGQWDTVTGQSGGLTSGAIYYLSSATAGAMTTTAPVSGFIVELGKALSTTKFDLTIRRPIRL